MFDPENKFFQYGDLLRLVMTANGGMGANPPMVFASSAAFKHRKRSANYRRIKRKSHKR